MLMVNDTLPSIATGAAKDVQHVMALFIISMLICNFLPFAVASQCTQTTTLHLCTNTNTNTSTNKLSNKSTPDNFPLGCSEAGYGRKKVISDWASYFIKRLSDEALFTYSKQ